MSDSHALDPTPLTSFDAHNLELSDVESGVVPVLDYNDAAIAETAPAAVLSMRALEDSILSVKKSTARTDAWQDDDISDSDETSTADDVAPHVVPTVGQFLPHPPPQPQQDDELAALRRYYGRLHAHDVAERKVQEHLAEKAATDAAAAAQPAASASAGTLVQLEPPEIVDLGIPEGSPFRDDESYDTAQSVSRDASPATLTFFTPISFTPPPMHHAGAPPPPPPPAPPSATSMKPRLQPIGYTPDHSEKTLRKFEEITYQLPPSPDDPLRPSVVVKEPGGTDPCARFKRFVDGREAPKLTDLSDDVLQYILSFSSQKTLLSLSETCRRMYSCASGNDLWISKAKTQPFFLDTVNRIQRKKNYSKFEDVDSKGYVLKKALAARRRQLRVGTARENYVKQRDREYTDSFWSRWQVIVAQWVSLLVLFLIVQHASIILIGLILDNTIPNDGYWWFLFAYLPWLLLSLYYFATFGIRSVEERYYPMPNFTDSEQKVDVIILAAHIASWIPALVICVGIKLIIFRTWLSWYWIMLPMSFFMLHVTLTSTTSLAQALIRLVQDKSMAMKAGGIIVVESVIFHYLFVWFAMLLSFLALDGFIPTKWLPQTGLPSAPVLALFVPHFLALFSAYTGIIALILIQKMLIFIKAALATYVTLVTCIGIVPTMVLLGLAVDKLFPGGFFFAFFPILGIAWIQIAFVVLVVVIGLILVAGYFIVGCICGCIAEDDNPLDRCFNWFSGDDD